MPYNQPYRAPFRPLPPGRPQLGFDPVTIATAISGFVGKLSSLGSIFGMDDKNKGRIQEAKDALAFAMTNPNDIFPGRTVTAREWINSQRIAPGGGSSVGRAAYQAAWDQLMQWDQQQAAQGITTGGAGTAITTAGFTDSGSMLPLLLVGGLAVGAYLMTRRKS